MANYCAFIRTNYFKVTDEQRFREIIKSCSCEEGELEVFENDWRPNTFGFGCYGSIYGLKKAGTEDGELDEDINDFFLALQEVLPEGEAIIFTEVGYEKLRYLIAYSVVITKSSIDTVDLRQEAFKLAGSVLGIKDYTTEDQY